MAHAKIMVTGVFAGILGIFSEPGGSLEDV